MGFHAYHNSCMNIRNLLWNTTNIACFLDIQVYKDGSTIKTDFFRKPHRSQYYIPWELFSYHAIGQKSSDQ